MTFTHTKRYVLARLHRYGDNKHGFLAVGKKSRWVQTESEATLFASPEDAQNAPLPTYENSTGNHVIATTIGWPA